MHCSAGRLIDLYIEFLLQILGSSFLTVTSQDPGAYEDGLHAIVRRGEAIAVAVWESSGRLFPVSGAWARAIWAT